MYTSSVLAQEHVTFSFGKNWRAFLESVDPETVQAAEKSFIRFTGLSSLAGESFLDLGCGSGLSSLVAHRLGAKVLSVDVDPDCIRCASTLRGRFAQGADWEIRHGSVLDQDFLDSLGRHSYVYSWGVLHHTGAMWQALSRVLGNVEPGGRLHIALYNKHRNSRLWLHIKRLCNRWPRTIFPVMRIGLAAYGCSLDVAHGRSPWRMFREYRANRGMTVWRDIDDWLGGLPYEYCSSEEVTTFLAGHGFEPRQVQTTTTKGCNEFLFQRR